MMTQQMSGWSNPAFSKFRKTFEKDEVLCYQSDTDRRLFILLEGGLNIFVAGKRIALVNKSGSFLGEMSFLSGKARSATIKAEDKTIVLEFDFAVVQQLVDMETSQTSLPSITTVMLETITKRYEEIKKQVDDTNDKYQKRKDVLREIFNELLALYEKKIGKPYYEVEKPESEAFFPLYELLKFIENSPHLTLNLEHIEIEDTALKVARTKDVKGINPKMRIELAKRLCDHLSPVDEDMVNFTNTVLEIREFLREIISRLAELYKSALRLPDVKEIMIKYRRRLELQ